MVVHACSPSTKEVETGGSRGQHIHRNNPSKNPSQPTNHTQIKTASTTFKISLPGLGGLAGVLGITDLGFLNLFAFVLDKRKRETKENGGLAECYPGCGWVPSGHTLPPHPALTPDPGLSCWELPGQQGCRGSLCPLVLSPLLLFCI